MAQARRKPTPGEQFIGLLKFLIVLGGIIWFFRMVDDTRSFETGSAGDVAAQLAEARMQEYSTSLPRDLELCRQGDQFFCNQFDQTVRDLASGDRAYLEDAFDFECDQGRLASCLVVDRMETIR